MECQTSICWQPSAAETFVAHPSRSIASSRFQRSPGFPWEALADLRKDLAFECLLQVTAQPRYTESPSTALSLN